MFTKNKKIQAKPKSPFLKFCDNNIYVFLAFLCSAVLMLLVYYCFDLIPFGSCTVLRMDLYHQYGPLFAELYDRLTQFKSLIYSWNTGGGGAFLGNYYNYLSSPIGGLITLFAGHENVPEAIGIMVLVKNGLASASLAFYLKKAFNKNDFTIIAFGILYAFCGFFIAYYWNVMWIDAMCLLPLVVLGIENIINKRKCRLYVITLALAFFSSYYMAYMLCIFAVLYFIVYFISNYGFKETYDDIPKYEDDDGTIYNRKIHLLTYNKFLRSGFWFAVSSLIAACLIAFALIPTYYCLKACSATSGTFPTDPKFYNNIFDFIANHLASVEPTIRSSGDTVLPNVYCGILTVILIPLYIFCNKINMKERVAHIVLLAVFFVGFNLNYANYILHAFHFPNDLPFRFSFIYSFVLIIMAFKVLTYIKEISPKAIIGSGLGIIVFTVAVQKIGMENVTDTTVYISIGFVALYTIVLGIMHKKEYAQSAVALLLMCCVFAEAAVSDTDHFQINQIKTNFSNGYPDFRKLKDSMDEKEGNDTYRMELSNINTLMDASWFDYNGLSVFSSMAYESSSNLQNQLGMDSNYINSYIYHPQTPVYNAMMSLKYLVNNDGTKMNPNLYSFSLQCGKFAAYKNNYYLPIGFGVNSATTEWDTSSSNPFTVQSDFWQYATGLTDVFSTINSDDYLLDNIGSGQTDFSSGEFSFYKENADGEGMVTLNYTIPESQNVYFYLKCPDIDSINVYTDDGFTKNQGIDEPYILDCGYCKEGTILTVEIPVDADKDSGYVECYAAGLNMDVFTKGYQMLLQNSLEVSEFKDTSIKGTVNMQDGKILYTSINYDDGWKVMVDGEEVEKVKIGGALIGVNVPKGEHTIEFKFHQQGLLLGVAISGVTAILVIAYFVLEYLKKNKRSSVPVAPELQEKRYELPTSNSGFRAKGIEALMEEDLGRGATVEQAEALLEEPDEFENSKVDAAESINRADQILKVQRHKLNDTLNEVQVNDNQDNDNQDKD